MVRKRYRSRLLATFALLLASAPSFGSDPLNLWDSSAPVPDFRNSDSFSSLEDLGRLQQGLLGSIRAQSRTGKVPMDKSLIHVTDGDTLFYGGKEAKRLNLRVLGIDTPEVHHYSAGKFDDQEYGEKAKEYVRGIIYRADKLEYLPCGEDIYGRTLAHIFADDQLLAVKVLKRGYAYETISHYGDNGHPELASAILAAAQTGPTPPFENPYLWRKRMWSAEKEKAELDKDAATPRTAVDKAQISFQDGDTVYFGPVEIRVLGVDTPEIAHPEHDKPEGQEHGPEAAEFTKQAILRAKKVEYILGPGSTYGRSLAHVFVDGELLSLRLIKARLAYETVSRYGASGFPGYARVLLEAFRSVPTPPFQNPQYWRWEHWSQPKPEPVDPDPGPLAETVRAAY